MEEKELVYGLLIDELVFMTESRVKYCTDIFNGFMNAKTWGEFRKMVSKQIYDRYTKSSFYFNAPGDVLPEDIEKYYFPDDRRFTPNEVYIQGDSETQPAFPEIEMSSWVPQDIQDKYGKITHYYLCSGLAPKGDVLILDVNRMDEIVSAMQSYGYTCRRDDSLLRDVMGINFNPEDYEADIEEEE